MMTDQCYKQSFLPIKIISLRSVAQMMNHNFHSQSPTNFAIYIYICVSARSIRRKPFKYMLVTQQSCSVALYLLSASNLRDGNMSGRCLKRSVPNVERRILHFKKSMILRYEKEMATLFRICTEYPKVSQLYLDELLL